MDITRIWTAIFKPQYAYFFRNTFKLALFSPVLHQALSLVEDIWEQEPNIWYFPLKNPFLLWEMHPKNRLVYRKLKSGSDISGAFYVWWLIQILRCHLLASGFYLT